MRAGQKVKFIPTGEIWNLCNIHKGGIMATICRPGHRAQFVAVKKLVVASGRGMQFSADKPDWRIRQQRLKADRLFAKRFGESS